MKVSTSQRENYVQSNLFDFFDNNKIDISVHRPASKIKAKKKIAKKPMISTKPENRIMPIQISYRRRDRLDDDSEDYSLYVPQIYVEGSQAHPTKLCESIAMSSVDLPPVEYQPSLFEHIIKTGILSDAQLEDIVLAGNAHSQLLPDGRRRGFFLGSGTGYGKGRTIAGVILDNFLKGRKKAVWISKNDKAHMDSPTYWTDVGGQGTKLIFHERFKPKHKILYSEGVLLTTFGMLRAGYIPGIAENDKKFSGRLQQILAWLGSDFDGVIVFDESHKMANAVDQKGVRGIKKASLTAQVGLELQKALPKARIVYSSATGATEVYNLIYADRLGLWGEGTDFSNGIEFVNQIDKSGVSAMELVAKDLKSLGLYTAKTLSYSGVKYETLIHPITPVQQELYDKLARAWQIILQRIEEAIELNKTHSRAKAAALSAFWSTHQRFFNQIILTIQLPSMLEDIEWHLENGESIILQLTNTNEAATKRALATAKGDQKESFNYEELDLSPKAMILEMIQNSFPTVLFEEFEDDAGVISSRPVLDSAGNYIHNRAAIKAREELMAEIESSLRIPESPLDIFVNHFGSQNVAEVTGRTLRIVKHYDQKGEWITKEERRNPSKVKSEISDFKNDKRRILIFSDAGGTGASFHAAKNILNQCKRIHYVFQAGWKADSAVQGFGRSHRSNQVIPPMFKLVTTNIIAQKRFLSSIARRLEQLGALTKGQRTTGGQGILDNSYNLEGPYAKEALYLLYSDILQKSTPLSPEQVKTMMGLTLMRKVEGTEEMNMDIVFDIRRFLNRLLSLEIDVMNRVFQYFLDHIEMLIQQAKANGTYEEGIEYIHAQNAKVIEEEIIHQDKVTGANTFLTTLELEVPNEKTSWDAIQQESQITTAEFLGYFVKVRSKKIYGLFRLQEKADASGQEYSIIRRVGILTNSNFESPSLDDISRPGNYIQLNESQAQKLWMKQFKRTPETRISHQTIVKGLVLPIWSKLPSSIIIRRYIDESGNAHLGRYIREDELTELRQKFSLSYSYGIEEIMQTLNNKGSVLLANDFRLRKSKAQSQEVVYIEGTKRSQQDTLRELGAAIRIKNALMETKDVFLPWAKAREQIEKLIELFDAPAVQLFKA